MKENQFYYIYVCLLYFCITELLCIAITMKYLSFGKLNSSKFYPCYSIFTVRPKINLILAVRRIIVKLITFITYQSDKHASRVFCVVTNVGSIGVTTMLVQCYSTYF